MLNISNETDVFKACVIMRLYKMELLTPVMDVFYSCSFISSMFGALLLRKESL